MGKWIKLILIIFLFLTQNAGADEKLKLLKEQYAKTPQNEEAMLKLGIYYHNSGADGDEKSVKEAVNILEKILGKYPANNEALAWYGSTLTMMGRDAFFPWTKLKYVNNGLDNIDKAVDKDPENINIRMVRAINGINLPAMFKRLSISIKDLMYIQNKKEFATSPKTFQSTVYYWLGIGLQKDNQLEKSIQYLKLAIKTSPESEEGKKAKEELKNLSVGE